MLKSLETAQVQRTVLERLAGCHDKIVAKKTVNESVAKSSANNKWQVNRAILTKSAVRE